MAIAVFSSAFNNLKFVICLIEFLNLILKFTVSPDETILNAIPLFLLNMHVVIF